MLLRTPVFQEHLQTWHNVDLTTILEDFKIHFIDDGSSSLSPKILNMDESWDPELQKKHSEMRDF